MYVIILNKKHNLTGVNSDAIVVVGLRGLSSGQPQRYQGSPCGPRFRVVDSSSSHPCTLFCRIQSDQPVPPSGRLRSERIILPMLA